MIIPPLPSLSMTASRERPEGLFFRIVVQRVDEEEVSLEREGIGAQQSSASGEGVEGSWAGRRESGRVWVCAMCAPRLAELQPHGLPNQGGMGLCRRDAGRPYALTMWSALPELRQWRMVHQDQDKSSREGLMLYVDVCGMGYAVLRLSRGM